MKRTLALVVLAACSTDVPVTEIIVDTPGPATPADPWTDVDIVTMTVTENGVTVLEESFNLGEDVRLDDTPDGPGIAVHLTGRATTGGGAVQDISYGRTCLFDSTIDDRIHLWFSHIVRWAHFGAPGSPEGTPSAPGRTGGFGFTDDEGGAAFLGGGAQSVDRFDARTGAFETLAATVLERHGGGMAPFGARSVLLVGGTTDPDPSAMDAPIAVIEAVSPTADEAGQLQTVTDPRVALVDHTVTPLVGGGVFVAGGRSIPTGEPHPEVYEITPGPGGAPEVRLINELMAFARAGHTATPLGGEVGADIIIIGGVDVNGDLVLQAELYEPLSETFAPLTGDNPFDGVLPAELARRDHVALGLPDDTILIIGGVGKTLDETTMLLVDAPMRQLAIYDPHRQEFSQAALLSADAGYLGFTATPLPDGRILLAGGLGGDLPGAPVDTVYIAEFNPMTGSVTLLRTDSLQAPRAGHSAALLCDGTVLLVGGTADPTAPPAERYNPPSAGRL
jgi:hypothetical protein